MTTNEELPTCRRHPGAYAVFVCARCEMSCCAECVGTIASLCATCAPIREKPAFHPVSPQAFVVLSLATIGLYPMYWAYRCWTYIRRRDGSTIWALPRAVLLFLTFASLMSEIDDEASPRDVDPDLLEHPLARIGQGGQLSVALVYFLLSGLGAQAGLLATLGFNLAPLCFLPAVGTVRSINASSGHLTPAWGLRPWQWGLVVAGLCLSYAVNLA